jgi:hypothetical protein
MQALELQNAAFLQLQVTKGQRQFLSTLPKGGVSQFLTVLKPCSLILRHLHPRGTELFSILSGTLQ